MTAISLLDIALRLTLVVVLCGAIGFERESRDQPAGVRTHVLVGMGAAIFTLISAYGFAGLATPGAPIDPTRIAAQIVTGVGFLGAGAIIHQGMAVRGLTTAAAVWISAAIGMAAGIGFYSLAFTGAALVLVALLVFRRVRSSLSCRCNSVRSASVSSGSGSRVVEEAGSSTAGATTRTDNCCATQVLYCCKAFSASTRAVWAAR